MKHGHVVERDRLAPAACILGGMPLVSVVVVVGRHWCQWRWWDAAGVGGGGGKALVSVVVVVGCR